MEEVKAQQSQETEEEEDEDIVCRDYASNLTKDQEGQLIKKLQLLIRVLEGGNEFDYY